MKKVGLYFGSFNPIHSGHLIIAEHFATRTELDEVWLVVSPQNPFKNVSELAPEAHRLEMVKLAIINNPKLQACDAEFAMEKPSYSIDTLNLLSKNFPFYSFTLLIGEDNVTSFHKWKEAENILNRYAIKIFPRLHNGVRSENTLIGKNVAMTEAPIIEISSTYIRKSVKASESIRYLTPEGISDYINLHKLYR